MSNDLRREIILKYNSVPNNIYTKEKNTIYNFLEDFSEKYNITYKVKRYKKRKRTDLYYKDNYIGGMVGVKPSTTGKIAFDICRDKFRLENFLIENKIDTLESKLFLKEEKDKAKEYIKSNPDVSYVLKPLNLAGGKGIELGINHDTFSSAWDNSMRIQRKSAVKEPACIVQPYIDGFDIRICIIEGVYAAALLRIPAHIVGDGTHSIEELIDQKNKNRMKTEYFNKRLIIINEVLKYRLKEQGYDITDILKNSEIVMLNKVGNLLAGADSIDITNQVSVELINLALNATAALPGLHTSGVDIMTPDYRKESGYIIEVNTNANHKVHHLPFKGEQRFPYDQFIKSLLIKYKIKNSIPLVEDEFNLNREMQSFLNLKNDYIERIYHLTGL